VARYVAEGRQKAGVARPVRDRRGGPGQPLHYGGTHTPPDPPGQTLPYDHRRRPFFCCSPGSRCLRGGAVRPASRTRGRLGCRTSRLSRWGRMHIAGPRQEAGGMGNVGERRCGRGGRHGGYDVVQRGNVRRSRSDGRAKLPLPKHRRLIQTASPNALLDETALNSADLKEICGVVLRVQATQTPSHPAKGPCGSTEPAPGR
jgi:hypothetical protein